MGTAKWAGCVGRVVAGGVGLWADACGGLAGNRLFKEFDARIRADTAEHIGTHPIIMNRLPLCPAFQEQINKVALAAKAFEAARNADPPRTDPFTVAVYCREGMQGSVAFACFLMQCLKHELFWEAHTVSWADHISKFYWYHTCQGSCLQCMSGSGLLHSPAVQSARALFRQVYDAR